MGECGCNLEVTRCKAHARGEVIFTIAAELDKPSVFMGGPSRRSFRIATAIMERLSRFDVGGGQDV